MQNAPSAPAPPTRFVYDQTQYAAASLIFFLVGYGLSGTSVPHSELSSLFAIRICALGGCLVSLGFLMLRSGWFGRVFSTGLGLLAVDKLMQML